MKTEETIQSIQLQIAQSPSCALTDPTKKAELYAFLENEIAVFVPDLSTEKGRKAIAALAYKIARTKSAIDDAGAKLKEDWLKKSREVDAGRREIRERLDALKDRAREPLTQWEADEQKRTEWIARAFEDIRQASIISHDDTVETVKARLKVIAAYPLDEAVFQSRTGEARDAKAAACLSLRKSIDKLEEEEFDRQELARLRKESEDRREQDRIAAEAAELARLTKIREEKEAQRLCDMEAERIKAEAYRAEREAKVAEDAKIEAENRVRREFEESQRVERERLQAALDKERKDRADAEAAHAREDARLNAEAEKKLADERKLAANKKHRAKVISDAVNALLSEMIGGMDSADALQVIKLISDGKIPAVSINFGSEAK